MKDIAIFKNTILDTSLYQVFCGFCKNDWYKEQGGDLS